MAGIGNPYKGNYGERYMMGSFGLMVVAMLLKTVTIFFEGFEHIDDAILGVVCIAYGVVVYRYKKSLTTEGNVRVLAEIRESHARTLSRNKSVRVTTIEYEIGGTRYVSEVRTGNWGGSKMEIYCDPEDNGIVYCVDEGWRWVYIVCIPLGMLLTYAGLSNLFGW